MARKPLEQLSPAYRRRIERAEAKGLPRQAARGHKPREHVARRAAEEHRAGQSGYVTSGQLQTVRPFFLAQIAKAPEYAGEDPAEVWRETMIPLIRERGFSWALRIRAHQRELASGVARVRGARERAGGVGAPGGVMVGDRVRLIGSAAVFYDQYVEPLDAEPWMLFYH